MYYRKYFSGTVDATTTTNQYYMGLDKIATGTSRTSGHIKNRSDVIGNALVSTFRDIGYPNAYWDSTSGYFFLDKTNSLCGIYITVQSSYIYYSVGYNSGGLVNSYTNSSTTYVYASYQSIDYRYAPFIMSGTGITDYAFYVTIKGEPKGTFSVHIGAYNDHAYEAGMYFYITNGVDKRDNSVLYGFSLLKENPYRFYMLKASDAVSTIGVNSVSYFIMNNNRLVMVNETVVLIPVLFTQGFIMLTNTYLNPGITTLGFYEIDGDIYQVDSYYITKCITEV